MSSASTVAQVPEDESERPELVDVVPDEPPLGERLCAGEDSEREPAGVERRYEAGFDEEAPPEETPSVIAPVEDDPCCVGLPEVMLPAVEFVPVDCATAMASEASNMAAAIQIMMKRMTFSRCEGDGRRANSSVMIVPSQTGS